METIEGYSAFPTTEEERRAVPNINPIVDTRLRSGFVKVAEVTGVSTALSNIVFLNGIVRGYSYNERIGNVVHIHEVDIRVSRNNGINTEPLFTRYMCVGDSGVNGSTPLLASIVEPTYSWQSHYTYSTSHRFNVYYDRTFACGGKVQDNPAIGTDVFDPFQSAWHRIHFNFKPAMISQYTASGGTISSIITNAIYFVFVHSAAGNPPNLTYNTRVYYTDS